MLVDYVDKLFNPVVFAAQSPRVLNIALAQALTPMKAKLNKVAIVLKWQTCLLVF